VRRIEAAFGLYPTPEEWANVTVFVSPGAQR
jgi:hypothetical protein